MQSVKIEKSKLSSHAKKDRSLCIDFYFMQVLEWYVIIRTEHRMIITPSVTADNL